MALSGYIIGREPIKVMQASTIQLLEFLSGNGVKGSRPDSSLFSRSGVASGLLYGKGKGDVVALVH